jgi:hypothetical protein
MSRRILLAIVCGLCLQGLLPAQPRKVMLIDFETEAEQKAHTMGDFMVISTEHATSGKYSLKITTPGNYMGLSLKDPAMLKKLADYRTLALDVYNPLPFPIQYYVKVEDAKKARYANDYNFIPPGASTIRLSLQALPLQWPNVGHYVVDPASLQSITFFLGRDSGTWDPPVQFYIDNVRAEHSGVELPKVEGLKAFNFGRGRETGAFFGCTAVTEQIPPYPNKLGFGWQKGPWPILSSGGNPDLLGNSVLNGTFAVDLKPGQYLVHACIDPINIWGWSCQFSSRRLKLCGKEVLNETMDCKTFLKERFCMFEDDEDTPSTDLWNDRVHRISPVRSFKTTVGDDGRLTVEYSGVNAATGMCFLVVYPKERVKEGAAYMTAMDAIRKEEFDAKMNLGLPVADGAAPTPTAAEKARGFIAFPRAAEGNLDCRSVPASEERGAALALQAAQGERASIQLGLYPLSGVKDLSIVPGDLKGPGGATIPAAAIDIKKVRHYFKRFGNGSCTQLRPLVLRKFETLELTPGFTRPLWIALKVPEKLPAGQYRGSLKIKVGDKVLDMPLSVTVSPFALDAADDISISGMGSSAGFWRQAYADADEPWWAAAEAIMAIQAEHGFNALTGGPGMKLRGVKDGKADIDFADADRWMELARKHGLTRLGDSYIGFDVALGVPGDGSQGAYGLSFGELLKASYSAVEQHAKQMNWPPRAYYRIDEPNGEAVESTRKLVEQYVKNAPGCKFSGYYAPAAAGSPRDCFYPLLQLSILSSVTEPILKTIHEAGNQSWIYINPGYSSYQNFRHLYGRWMFMAHERGLDGVTGGFYFVNTVPYYDMSDLEGGWGVVYPGKDGVNGTVWLEQIGLGINDYRYLKTVKSRLDAAKKKGSGNAAVTEAERFLAEMDKACSLQQDTWRMSSKDLAKPADFASLRERATRLIRELSR